MQKVVDKPKTEEYSIPNRVTNSHADNFRRLKMRKKYYSKQQSEKTVFYKTLKEARAEARKRGEGFEVVRGHNNYWRGQFYGYAVVLSMDV